MRSPALVVTLYSQLQPAPTASRCCGILLIYVFIDNDNPFLNCSSCNLDASDILFLKIRPPNRDAPAREVRYYHFKQATELLHRGTWHR